MRRMGALAALAVAVFGAVSIVSVLDARAAQSAGPVAASPLTLAIVSQAGAQGALEKDKTVKAWLSEIEGYYRVAGTQPLWVDDIGYTANGLSLADEISRAYTYGLDNAQFQLPDMSAANLGTADLAAAEISLSVAAAKYVWHARGGRVDPSKLSLWLDQAPRGIYASDVLARFAQTQDAAAILRSYHPQHQQFENLRQAYLKERGLVAPDVLVPIAPGPKVQLGGRHPDVALVRQRLGMNAADPAFDDVLDRRLMGAIRETMYDAGYERKNGIDDDVRLEVSKVNRARPGSNKALIDKMLVNLERWRWMPETMGKLHVWNNLPEFYTRVIKDGTIIHQEKIVIGTAATQTPIFSDSMSHVIFQPEWGVPESIKIRQLLPRLKGRDFSVLDRRNMQLRGPDGKRMSAGRINWSKVNIRDVSIVQGAGSDNPLGRLKFIFPNAHDVYMHDTPSKDLFETTVRTHSHGCIRVKNPDRFAEVILGETEGWTKADVKAQLAKRPTFQVDLKSPVPVHNTYFTVTADADGKVTSIPDVYGHDRRVLDALNGKSIASIAAADPALALRRQNKILEESVAAIAPPRKARPAAPRVAVAKAPSIFGNFNKPQPSYLKKGPGSPKQTFFLFQYQ
jgi:L,D-transpeptidase YcbB